jgi:hypothetical protein
MSHALQFLAEHKQSTLDRRSPSPLEHGLTTCVCARVQSAGLGKNAKERYVVIKLRLFLQLLSCEDPEVTGMILERMQKFIGNVSNPLVRNPSWRLLAGLTLVVLALGSQTTSDGDCREGRGAVDQGYEGQPHLPATASWYGLYRQSSQDRQLHFVHRTHGAYTEHTAACLLAELCTAMSMASRRDLYQGDGTPHRTARRARARHTHTHTRD